MLFEAVSILPEPAPCTFGPFRGTLESFRALSGTFGSFRAVSGFVRNCPKPAEGARKRLRLPEIARSSFG
eukprot:3307049-Alexandrium_andersonii.AAC.1